MQGIARRRLEDEPPADRLSRTGARCDRRPPRPTWRDVVDPSQVIRIRGSGIVRGSRNDGQLQLHRPDARRPDAVRARLGDRGEPDAARRGRGLLGGRSCGRPDGLGADDRRGIEWREERIEGRQDGPGRRRRWLRGWRIACDRDQARRWPDDGLRLEPATRHADEPQQPDAHGRRQAEAGHRAQPAPSPEGQPALQLRRRDRERESVALGPEGGPELLLQRLVMHGGSPGAWRSRRRGRRAIAAAGRARSGAGP